MSNAVNFTDVLDGLSGIITASASRLREIAHLQARPISSSFCFIWSARASAFCVHAHPRNVYGRCRLARARAALGTVALMTGQWLLLPLVAIIPVSEVVTVMLQVSYFRRRKAASVS